MVHSGKHVLSMESVRSGFSESSMDPGKTSIVTRSSLFLETDGFSFNLAGAGKTVLWYVKYLLFSSRELMVFG
jgi:hypothetical protein